MGMFDELVCKFPLPSGYEFMQPRRFQTKSLECQLNTYTITEDGDLCLSKACRHKLDDSILLDFHGDIEFYDFEDIETSSPFPIDRNQIRFIARFTEGRVTRIWVVADKQERRCADSIDSVNRTTSTVAGQVTPDKLREIEARAEAVESELRGTARRTVAVQNSAADVPLLVAEVRRFHSVIDKLMDDMLRITEDADAANDLRARNAELEDAVESLSHLPAEVARLSARVAELKAAFRPLVNVMDDEEAYPEDVFLALDQARAAIENHDKAS